MRVLIAGVASHIGRLLAARLIADPEIDSVTGLDDGACTPPVPGMRFIRAPLTGTHWRPVLDNTDAVIALYGLAWPPHWRNRAAGTRIVAASKHLADAAAAARIQKIITANSAALYGVQTVSSAGDRAGNRIDERAPVRGYNASAYAHARAQIADYLTLFAASYPGTLTRLRAGWLCGPHHVALLRQFTSEPVLACGSETRALSLIHEADFVEAVRFALHQNLPGVYNLAAEDALSFNDIAALTDKQHACTPLPWLVVRAYVRWRWLRWRTPPLWVRALYRGAPLDVSKLNAAGWHAEHSARTALFEALNMLRD